MSDARFAVSWANPAYPKVRRTSLGDPHGVTFDKAKKQIDDHFFFLIAHAQDQCARLRDLRAGDVR